MLSAKSGGEKILENIENLQAQDFMEKQLYEELFQ